MYAIYGASSPRFALLEIVRGSGSGSVCSSVTGDLLGSTPPTATNFPPCRTIDKTQPAAGGT